MLSPDMPVAIVHTVEEFGAKCTVVRLFRCMDRLIVAYYILLLYRCVRAVLYAASIADDLRIVLAVLVASVSGQYLRKSSRA
jgi:hypothetical protein